MDLSTNLPSLDTLIAARVKALRLARAWSLAEMALRTGVSKAMLSRVERGGSSASAALLGRIAAGIGVPLGELVAQGAEPVRRLQRRAEQAVWCDPLTGYRRRQVAARHPQMGVELVEVELPRGARVGYGPWATKAYPQRLWLVDGVLAVNYGDEAFNLEVGDCLDFATDRPVAFRAVGAKGCRYLLVMHTA